MALNWILQDLLLDEKSSSVTLDSGMRAKRKRKTNKHNDSTTEIIPHSILHLLHLLNGLYWILFFFGKKSTTNHESTIHIYSTDRNVTYSTTDGRYGLHVFFFILSLGASSIRQAFKMLSHRFQWKWTRIWRTKAIASVRTHCSLCDCMQDFSQWIFQFSLVFELAFRAADFIRHALMNGPRNRCRANGWEESKYRKIINISINHILSCLQTSRRWEKNEKKKKVVHFFAVCHIPFVFSFKIDQFIHKILVRMYDCFVFVYLCYVRLITS